VRRLHHLFAISLSVVPTEFPLLPAVRMVQPATRRRADGSLISRRNAWSLDADVRCKRHGKCGWAVGCLTIAYRLSPSELAISKFRARGAGRSIRVRQHFSARTYVFRSVTPYGTGAVFIPFDHLGSMAGFLNGGCSRVVRLCLHVSDAFRR
jgi:hypothetical protein